MGRQAPFSSASPEFLQGKSREKALISKGFSRRVLAKETARSNRDCECAGIGRLGF